ncbi:spore germination protein [Paenibacillus eucommiae]|uniref:Spore germination protein n=1 Tax=Paenibacillus eucommiae TaxID=1355755 RepID=A0ABS4IU55_9BACL|nr:spore germination protein [Paenibacillus eucommiae]MBP1991117.1 hypothetical protein [Paenibacillus eucommiae]
MGEMLENMSIGQEISWDLNLNRKWFEQIFANCQDMMIESWSYGPALKYAAFSVCCQSLVEDDHNEYMKSTLQDLVQHEAGMTEPISPEQVRYYYTHTGVSSQSRVLLSTYEEVQRHLLEGFVLIFFDQWNQAISYKMNKINKRAVTEPTSEPVVQGPREGTVENLDTNLGMLRQRVKSPLFKIEFFIAGTIMKTKVAFAYLEQAVNPEVLKEFRNRLQNIEPYEVQGTSYIEEWIEDSTYSPFPQHRYTERTDTAAAAVLDGKILVLVENSPMILICPSLFVDFFGTSEDYYVRTVYSTLIRLLRVLAFFIALTLPSIYVAFSTFHPELIPTVLLLAILGTREGIPFPAFLEALIMEVCFELLREAGIRLPRPVGSAVSIVGALVIGQAAIQAKIASPTMVIVVALTGIASFAIPHYDMAIAVRVLRFPFMVAAGMLGGFGLMIVFLLTFLHLTSLHTLGQPYLSSLAPLQLKDMRDVFIRAPLKRLLRSPRNRHLHKSRGKSSP